MGRRRYGAPAATVKPAHRTSGAIAYRLLAVISPILTVCCSSDDHIENLELTTGVSVADLAATSTCVGILVLPPQECITCDGLLETWMAVRRSLRFELSLVLTGEPNGVQAEALQIRRAPLAGILSSRRVATQPTAYLFETGALVDSIVGIGQQVSFLRALEPPPEAPTLGGNRVVAENPCPWAKWSR